MGVSGFPIKGTVQDSRRELEPWFNSGEGTFTAVTDDSGNAVLTVASHNVDIGDTISLASTGANYQGTVGNVTATTSTTITTDIVFNGDDAGFFFIDESLTFPDTPINLLREVHVQFDTKSSVTLQVTLDALNYMDLNNNQTLVGLATFTMFVVKDARLNFRITGTDPNTSQNIGVVVTSA